MAKRSRKKTKPPKLSKPRGHKFKDNRRLGSKVQRKLAKYVSHYFGGDAFVLEKTFDWLKSTNGKHNLYIDIFFPKYKLCIEYHGPQHYQFPNRYHKSKKEFMDQRKRDRLKVRKLKEQGYTVKIWPYRLSITMGKVKEVFEGIKL